VHYWGEFPSFFSGERPPLSGLYTTLE